jgi:uncharacterized protein DUF6044
MEFWKNKNYSNFHRAEFALSNFIVFLYLLPLILLGENAYVGINDVLDAHVIWYRILANNGLVFASSYTPIHEIMAVPRLSLYNEFYLLFWIHYLIGTFPAIVVNLFIIHFTALWGMYLLLTKLKFTPLAIFFAALFFSLLPFSQFWGLSIAGQPLVLYSLLRIRQKGFKIKYCMLLLFYVLYANFYAVSVFYFAVLSIFFIISFIKLNSISWPVVTAIILMISVSILMEYRLVESLFFNDSFVSIRVERNMQLFKQPPFYPIKLALFGHYYARSFLFLLIPMFLYSFWILSKKNEEKIDWRVKYVLGVFLLVIIVALVAQIDWIYNGYKNNPLNIYSFKRINTLLPIITVLLAAVMTNYLTKHSNVQNLIKSQIAVIIIFLWLTNPTLLALIPSSELINNEDKISFKNFFSIELFEEIKNYIGEEQDNYKVASLGLYPSISQYNGFYTIDGYFTNYPLQYKKEFREIIKNELSQNEELETYFNGWGGRCYLFDNQLGKDFLYTKEKSFKIDQLQIDCDQFKKMGGRYILSAVPIGMFLCSTNVQYHRYFENTTWRIYLYEIY